MSEKINQDWNKIEEIFLKDPKLNITKKHLFEVIELKNSLLKKMLEERSKIEQSIKELTSEKIKFNGKMKFKQDLSISLPMGYSEIFNVKDKEFDIINWYIDLKWYEQWSCKDCKHNIETKFYFEDILEYWEILEK